MAYLIFAALMAAILISILYMKARPSRNPSRSVDSFERARKALEPRSPARRGVGVGGR